MVLAEAAFSPQGLVYQFNMVRLAQLFRPNTATAGASPAAHKGAFMSISQSNLETRIAWLAADEAAHNVMRLGGRAREAIAEWHRVYREIMDIARRSDVGDLSR